MKNIISLCVIISVIGIFVFVDPDKLDNPEGFPHAYSASEDSPSSAYSIAMAPTGWAAWLAGTKDNVYTEWVSLFGDWRAYQRDIKAMLDKPIDQWPPAALLGSKRVCLFINEAKYL